MTMIAILNADSDPHLLADTLLSVHGADRRGDKEIWLPSLGVIPSEQPTTGDPWYIYRLARKSLALPDGAGMLAYAGTGKEAAVFWAAYSEKILFAKNFDEDRRVDRALLEQCISDLHMPANLALLGVLVDADGKREVFRYGEVFSFVSDAYGTCYFAGSGSPYLMEKVRKADDAQNASRGVTDVYSVTEHLAEKLSANLLVHERFTDENGQSTGALHLAAGGFLEWYAVSGEGVRPIRERMDLHFEVNPGGLFANAIYLIGSKSYIDKPAYGSIISVIKLLQQPVEGSLGIDELGGWFYQLENLADAFGGLIEPSLHKVGQTASERGDDRLYGAATAATIKESYGDFIEIRRLRVTLSVNNQIISFGFVAPLDAEPFACVAVSEESSEVVVGDDVISTIVERAARLDPGFAKRIGM